MTFAELTFNPDQWNEDLERHVGFQAQWEADNGYLCVVDAEVGETPLDTATAEGQTYTVVVYKWDRSSHDGDASYSPIYSMNSGMPASEVETKLNEVNGYALPEPETDPNEESEETPSGSGQWD